MADESPMSDVEDDRHPVEVIAEDFADRVRRGEHPTVTDYVQRHPAHAEQLRELLPPIALMERLKKRNVASLSGGTSQAPLKLERLGDFRVVREVGRGGMGIVYEAQQESLDRHVALKVLSRASLLDPQRVQRFEREARAAANLHHTNIVPVFGVGEADGLHYYVMQFIEGRSLAEVLTELAGTGDHPGVPSRASARSGSGAAIATAAPVKDPPTGKRYWRWVADLGRQVAEALDYAHRQGTLHRDVKPANLILDERGNVWITDFGLAKLGEEFNQVTRTGDLVGTLQYMAPESLRANTDARSDIYGLGITLYELLTLRPAFNEPNPAALMRRVAEGEPVPPRRLNPHVPRDLETIILKAIARDPAARYPSAGGLAEDLANFLQDRPIVARRISAPERLWRWCRRNRAVAAALALAVVCAVAAIVVGWTAYGVTRRALAAENARRSEAEAARKRADENVQLSLQGFENIFNQLAPEDDLPPPMPRARQGGDAGRPGGGGGGGQRANAEQEAAVLKSILTFYDKFVEQNPASPSLQASSAKAYRRVGDSYFHLGQSTEADAAYRHAASLFAEQLRLRPESDELKAGFADAVTRLSVEADAPREDDAELIRRATAYAEEVAKGGQPRDLERLARLVVREGSIERKANRTAEAEASFKRAIALWQASGPPPRREGGEPRRPPRPPEGYTAQVALAELYVDGGRIDEAKTELARAADGMDRQWDQAPPQGRAQLGLAYDRLATVAAAAKDAALAQRARTRAGEAMEIGRGGAGNDRGRPGPPPPRRQGGPPDDGFDPERPGRR